MHIAVSGVHASGKTTLVNWISRQWSIYSIGEQARNLLENSYGFAEVEANERVFKEFQKEIIKNQHHEEFMFRDQSYVVDRSAMDSFTYVIERLSKERSFDVEYRDWYETQVIEMMSNYDLIFFIRYNPHFNSGPRGDAYRNGNSLYMETLDRILHSLYMEPPSTFKGRIVPLSTPVWEERVQTVESVMDGLEV
jgi:nicotinamide riboside kinase